MSHLEKDNVPAQALLSERCLKNTAWLLNTECTATIAGVLYSIKGQGEVVFVLDLFPLPVRFASLGLERSRVARGGW